MVCAALTVLAALCATWPAGAAQSPQNFAQIERGRYLTVAADCAACHTDPVRRTPFAGGRPVETPFGAVAAANITPDRETGIGGWSDSDFERAVREGVMPDGKRLYPAMPYPYFTHMSRADVLAIRAYLATVAPVHHVVRSNQLPFPFNIRALMRLWDAWYFEPGEYKSNPGKSPAWNRGGYLVEGPGHCAACHSPKNFLGADRAEQRFRGYSLQGWFAPDITNDPQRGLGNWSQTDIVEYLKTGHNRLAAASGPMAEEVAHSSSKMSDADLEAIATYLKDQRGQSESARSVAKDDRYMKVGAAIYADRCAACHKADGTGVPYLIPNLAQSSSVDSRLPLTALRVILRGARSVATPAEPTGPAMPSFGWQLSNAQVAAVTTYIRNSWGHAAARVTAEDVGKARSSLAERTD
jgi:mono/diheme cytochrome c family protein